MNPVFLDTVGLVAVWDKADQWHDDAEPVFLALVKSAQPIVTTTLVSWKPSQMTGISKLRGSSRCFDFTVEFLNRTGCPAVRMEDCMAWFADLAPCTYFGEANAEFLRAVSWVEHGKPFATGDVEPDVLERLIEFAKDPVQPVMFCGIYRCNLCPRGRGAASNRNVFIPSPDILFVYPEGIIHYIQAHGYQPPAEFCAAVRA